MVARVPPGVREEWSEASINSDVLLFVPAYVPKPLTTEAVPAEAAAIAPALVLLSLFVGSDGRMGFVNEEDEEDDEAEDDEEGEEDEAAEEDGASGPADAGNINEFRARLVLVGNNVGLISADAEPNNSESISSRADIFDGAASPPRLPSAGFILAAAVPAAVVLIGCACPKPPRAFGAPVCTLLPSTFVPAAALEDEDEDGDVLIVLTAPDVREAPNGSGFALPCCPGNVIMEKRPSVPELSRFSSDW